ncbi:glycosyl transferase [Leptospira yanagawae]|uniref:glycosyl transferase n=1 Tax=Leptospira yanagawae TaxID=293069 RepID=UPI001427BA1C|nr:glycosyl transferase [Leptospira yanagawae]
MLEKDTNSFIFIFAFDDSAFESLSKLSLSRVRVISLKEFENETLLSIKTSRSAGEYCWTCTPWVIKYCLENFEIGHCTYVDADLYFFANPQVLLDEVKDSSILITEHRYSERYDVTRTSGRFCVQFILFRNDTYGLTALHWWADKCIDWCYARFEDGKFGDQKYLDDWETRFEKVHVLNHLGGGVAPWNLQQYVLTYSSENSIRLIELSSGKEFDLVFYHFHEVKLKDGELDIVLYYEIPSASIAIHILYFNYLKENNQFLSDFKKEMFNELAKCLLSNYYLLSEQYNDLFLKFNYLSKSNKLKRIFGAIFNRLFTIKLLIRKKILIKYSVFRKKNIS